MKIKREALVSEYITDALLILMSKKSYKDITVTEICEKAGVTRMSFYRNFETKEDILKKHISGITDRFIADSGISYSNDSLYEYFLKLFTHLDSNKNLCMSVYKAGEIHIVKGEFDRVFLSLHTGEYDDFKSYFLAGGIYNVFLLWLENGCKEKPEELAGRLDRLFER